MSTTEYHGWLDGGPDGWECVCIAPDHQTCSRRSAAVAAERGIEHTFMAPAGKHPADAQFPPLDALTRRHLSRTLADWQSVADPHMQFGWLQFDDDSWVLACKHTDPSQCMKTLMVHAEQCGAK